MTLDYYKLDACQYFTSPGLAWEAALKMTGISLDLITDPLMYNFFELGLRGGVSMISKKYSKANHPEIQGYDPTKPTKSLIYLDANNLYGGGGHAFPPSHRIHALVDERRNLQF